MITRREVLRALAAAGLAIPLAAAAQQQRAKIARIGLLEGTSASGYKKGPEALIAGLRELGYVEGKNIIIEYRWAEGKYERLTGFAAEMVRMKVDVIVAASPPAIRAAQQATATIPIVMVRTGDPVAQGFVTSLSRPGKNTTGFSNMNREIIAKHVELLSVAVPKLSRVSVLANPFNPTHAVYLKLIQAAGRTNTVRISSAQATTVSELEAALHAIGQERAGALVVLPDSLFLAEARRIGEIAVQHRLPTMFWTRELVEAGGLMSYGQNVEEHFFRAATFVDKILKGSKPAELPVEQPTKIELVINLRTAKAIGLTIPQDLLFRADKVIE